MGNSFLYYFLSTYQFFQGNLRPEPRLWAHSPKDTELLIPKSSPLTYTQLPFYLHGLYNTDDIRDAISQIRDICEKYENRGLPNYPSGKYFDVLLWPDLLILLFSPRNPLLIPRTIHQPQDHPPDNSRCYNSHHFRVRCILAALTMGFHTSFPRLDSHDHPNVGRYLSAELEIVCHYSYGADSEHWI